MIVLNFSHPLTPAQTEQLTDLLDQPPTVVHDLPAQFDPEQPFEPQLTELIARIPLSSDEWQNEAILVNPPSLNFIAVALLADLHGRLGYFPAHMRLRRVADSLPPRFEVAEILNLQALRNFARYAHIQED